MICYVEFGLQWSAPVRPTDYRNRREDMSLVPCLLNCNGPSDARHDRLIVCHRTKLGENCEVFTSDGQVTILWLRSDYSSSEDIDSEPRFLGLKTDFIVYKKNGFFQKSP